MTILISVVCGVLVFLMFVFFIEYTRRNRSVLRQRMRYYADGMYGPAPASELPHRQKKSDEKFMGFVKEAGKRLAKIRRAENLDLKMQQAGLPILGSEFLVIAAMGCLLAGVIVFLLTMKPFVAIIVAIVALAGEWVYILYRIDSRRKDVEPQQKLPLKTALYILKDKDDKILFDIPVKGNIDNPEFSYMKIVWQTLGNLIVKVATSPIRALGNALGFGNDNLEFIEIEAHQRGLTSEQYHILGDLATIAKSDTLVFFTLEQHMPAPANDTVARGYEFRNDIVRRYLIEQGVNERQISVTTGEPVTDGEKTGYTITSEIKIEE